MPTAPSCWCHVAAVAVEDKKEFERLTSCHEKTFTSFAKQCVAVRACKLVKGITNLYFYEVRTCSYTTATRFEHRKHHKCEFKLKKKISLKAHCVRYSRVQGKESILQTNEHPYFFHV